MTSSKPKQFVRPPKKAKPKTAAPVTVTDFQEAADFEESAGGKHRGGDAVKSARAFVRALELYDRGLQAHPTSFDLAYNKARLQLELSQHPTIVEHIGVASNDWLEITLQSHRYALRLNEENQDVLFNTAQVLTSLAEQLLEDDQSSHATNALHESLELLSSCLSRQEMLLEQQSVAMSDDEEGGVALDQSSTGSTLIKRDDADTEKSDESATIEVPVSALDLLDTVHASLSAMTTLIPYESASGLRALGDMAHSLTEKNASSYIMMLPEDERERAHLTIALDRAAFIAAYANAQFEQQQIEFETYLKQLDTFDTIPGKTTSALILCAEADARKELVLACLDETTPQAQVSRTVCWKQLTLAQDLYSAAAKLTTSEAREHKAETYKSKGDVEVLRHRLASMTDSGKSDLSDTVRNSVKTLVTNASTFYRGAAQQASVDGEDDLEETAQERLLLTQAVANLVYGGEPAEALRAKGAAEKIRNALAKCSDEGLISSDLVATISAAL